MTTYAAIKALRHNPEAAFKAVVLANVTIALLEENDTVDVAVPFPASLTPADHRRIAGELAAQYGLLGVEVNPSKSALVVLSTVIDETDVLGEAPVPRLLQ